MPYMGDLCGIAVATHTFRLLTCLDETVSSIATSALKETDCKRFMKQPTRHDLAILLSSSLERELGQDGKDFASLWT